MKRLIIVTKKTNIFQSILAGYSLKFLIFNNRDDLNSFIPQLTDNDILISFNHNIIFSDKILSRIKIGYNIHAASLDFPGRDPHHWAIYNKTREYGAVLHVIEKKVDAGGIVDIINFNVDKNNTPVELLERANKAAQKLIIKLIDTIASDKKIKIQKELFWGENKKKRQDFFDICNISNDISEIELERIVKAFHIEGRKNIYTIIGNKKFFYCKEYL